MSIIAKQSLVLVLVYSNNTIRKILCIMAPDDRNHTSTHLDGLIPRSHVTRDPVYFEQYNPGTLDSMRASTTANTVQVRVSVRYAHTETT